MKKILLCLILCLLLPQLSLAKQEDAEVVIRHTPVPEDPPYQGEVRVLRRGSAQVVQTLLYSKVMIRVIGAIQRKESNSWPLEREGAQDSRRYSDELMQAYALVKERFKERQKAGEKERHIQLLIEFVHDGEKDYVALYAPSITQDDERLVLNKKELLKKLPLSRGYIQKNMQLIVQDSFRLDAGKAAALLQQTAGDR